MSSKENQKLNIEKVFLNLVERPLEDGKFELPDYSRGILRSAFNRAIEQFLVVRDRDPSVDPFSVVETAFIMNLELERKNKSPMILICPHKVAFKTGKKSPYQILVVQPSIPQPRQCETRINERGKLVTIRAEAYEELRKGISLILDTVKKKGFDFVCFPELFFLNDDEVCKSFSQLAIENDGFIIGGSFHDETRKSNTSMIFFPDGSVITQNKIFRAEGEGIVEKQAEILHIVDFSDGKFCVLICIDSEREAIRDILKERLQSCKCPELIFNPSNTEHPSRSLNLLANNLMSLIFAAVVFCNNWEKGHSSVLLPLAELKDKNFKIFELDASKETQIGEAKVDLSPLIDQKRSKHKCLISMVE